MSYHRLNIKVHLVFTPVVAGGSHITKTIFVIVHWSHQNWYLDIWKVPQKYDDEAECLSTHTYYYQRKMFQVQYQQLTKLF